MPVTWDDFVSLAYAMNGTDTDGDGKPDLHSVCFDIAPPVCKANFLLVAMMAPYLQYQGTQQVRPVSYRTTGVQLVFMRCCALVLGQWTRGGEVLRRSAQHTAHWT